MGKNVFFRQCRIRRVCCVLFFMVLMFLQSITFSAPAFSADGDLDTAGFNSPNGYTIADLGGAASAQAIAIQTDGKIVVGGNRHNGSNNDMCVARYNTDGTLDTTGFGSGNGYVVYSHTVDGADSVNAMAIQSDGMIVAAGTVYKYDSNWIPIVVRFKADGSGRDTTGFGSPNGYVLLDQGGTSSHRAYGLAVQTDGKILVSFSLSSIIYVVRLTTSGSYDTTFDTDGIKTIDIAGGTETVSSNGSNVLCIQSDNKIVVGARWNKISGYAQFAVVRLNTDGSLDTSFDTDGIQTTDFGDSAYLESITIQPSDGKIVAAGYARDGSDWGFALARYNTDGSLDTSFDTDGKLMTQLTVDQDYAHSVAIQSDGKIVAAGRSDQGPNDDCALVRYNTDGSLDMTNFGSPNGYVTTDVNTDHNRAYAVAIQSDGKIVAAGYGRSGGSSRFMVARYMSGEEFPWVMFIPAIIKKK